MSLQLPWPYVPGIPGAGLDNDVVEHIQENFDALALNTLAISDIHRFSPGAELGYDQITAGVTVSGTAIGSATTVIAGSAHTFNGTTVMAQFFAPAVTPGSGGSVDLYLMEGATQIGVIGSAGVNGNPAEPFNGWYRFAPASGSHTYSVVGVRSVANGTVTAAAAGTGAYVPAFLRFTKV